MQAAGINSVGGPIEALELPDPRPLADDEVLIEVRAAGVGNWEEFVRTGGWDIGRTPPLALGVECAGTLKSVGDAVDRWSPGDEVLTHPLPLRDQGAWAPLLIASEAVLARKPAAVSWEAAGAFPVPGLTAGQVIDGELGVGPEDSVLVHGASGVTGSVLVSLAAVRGAEVIATASPPNHERLARLGASHLLDYHDSGWPEKARELADGAGVSAAANAVTGGSADAMRSVRDGGRLVTITGDPPDPARGISNSALIVEPNGPQLEALAELLAAGKLEVQVAETYELADAAGALESALGGGGNGAVVIQP
jgi:NADPH:quinone reductase-like Zn-dependent oxidoreductase